MRPCRCRCDAVFCRQPGPRSARRRGHGEHGRHGIRAPTCWLMRTMPMSFRSWVKWSKVDSMAAVSVLLSTTRKFFCASAPAVMCCRGVSRGPAARHARPRYSPRCRRGAGPSPSPGLRQPLAPRWGGGGRRPAAAGRGAHLVTDDGEKLPVPVVCLRGHAVDCVRPLVRRWRVGCSRRCGS